MEFRGKSLRGREEKMEKIIEYEMNSITEDDLERRCEEVGLDRWDFTYLDKMAQTQNTFEDVLEGRKMWSEKGQVTRHDEDVLIIENVQPLKGMQRKDLVVVNFGSFLVCVSGSYQN